LDDDNTTIIPGHSGQIYEHGDGRLGVIFTSGDRFETREGWNNRRKACAAVGMTVHQNGDYEGTLLFDPKNAVQVQTAIQISGVRPRRQISAEHLAKLQSAGARHRFPAAITALETSGESNNVPLRVR
jgi:hypothetical protein